MVKMCIGGSEKGEVELYDVLKAVDELPTEEECNDEISFVLEIYDEKEMFHFSRFQRDSWHFAYDDRLENVSYEVVHPLTTNDVKKLIEMFFNRIDWKKMYSLKRLETIEYIPKGGKKMEIPSEIKSASAEAIAEKMFKFIKRYTISLGLDIETDIWNEWRRLVHMFWISEGCGNIEDMIILGTLDDDLSLKLMEAEIIVRQRFLKEKEDKEKERFEKERKELLPSLIKECVEWAREKGFNKLTKQDIEAFLFEKDIEISKLARRGLYLMVNVELKSKIRKQ